MQPGQAGHDREYMCTHIDSRFRASLVRFTCRHQCVRLVLRHRQSRWRFSRAHSSFAASDAGGTAGRRSSCRRHRPVRHMEEGRSHPLVTGFFNDMCHAKSCAHPDLIRHRPRIGLLHGAALCAHVSRSDRCHKLNAPSRHAIDHRRHTRESFQRRQPCCIPRLHISPRTLMSSTQCIEFWSRQSSGQDRRVTSRMLDRYADNRIR